LSASLPLSLAFLFASGAADSVSVALRHTLRNLVTPDRLRGRVSAAHATFAGGGPQLGEFEAGLVASWTSAPTAVVLGGLGTVAAAVVAARSVPALARLRWEGGMVVDGTSEAAKPDARPPRRIDESRAG
jgi:hypothetical protein